MKRVLVIGCPGSGKSTYSRALHRKTGLPLFHLDRMYWNADRTVVSKLVFRERLQKVLKQDEWIIDGNYVSTMEWRMQYCDTVFYLDYPAETCLNGVKERKGKNRPDMPWIEPADEQDEAFITLIKEYERTSKPTVLELLNRYSNINAVTFKNRSDAQTYLMSL